MLRRPAVAVVLRDLAGFKRFLAKPGATIQVVRNTFMDRQPEAARAAYRAKGLYAPRTVQALSRKAAVFTLAGHPGTVWLHWDTRARGWRFSGDTVTVPLAAGLGAHDEIVYRCSFADGFEPRPRPKAVRRPVAREAASPA
jgi:hypothetical protein